MRKSPLHDWAKKHGAAFIDSGLWYRSSWFPRNGATGWRESVDREVLNVRANAGLCDVSTLGKIEICGKALIISILCHVLIIVDPIGHNFHCQKLQCLPGTKKMQIIF